MKALFPGMSMEKGKRGTNYINLVWNANNISFCFQSGRYFINKEKIEIVIMRCIRQHTNQAT